MKMSLMAAAALLLAACAGAPPVQVRVKEVLHPVGIHAVRPEQIPRAPAPLGARPASPSAAADVLLAKLCEMVGYVIQADPLLRAAAGGVPGVTPRYVECEGMAGK